MIYMLQQIVFLSIKVMHEVSIPIPISMQVIFDQVPATWLLKSKEEIIVKNKYM